MENASKALLLAGGTLIGILILSLAVYLFTEFGSTSKEIHKQIEEQQVVEFNSRFFAYEGKEGITIYDIVTVAGYAYENNQHYNNQDEYRVIVKIDGTDIQNNINEVKYTRIKNDQELISINKPYLPTYKCKISGYNSNGRIRIIEFNKNQ